MKTVKLNELESIQHYDDIWKKIEERKKEKLEENYSDKDSEDNSNEE